MKESGQALIATMHAVTPETIRFIRERWRGPLVVKGVHRGDECQMMLDLGVDSFIVSNHGGRQLDSVLASIEVLPEVIEAVDGRGEVFVDSGFRRGSDVVKALAMGARGVLLGRAYLFGLSVAGQAGVADVLRIFRDEIINTMTLLGTPTLDDLDHDAIQLLPGYAGLRTGTLTQAGGSK